MDVEDDLPNGPDVLLSEKSRITAVSESQSTISDKSPTQVGKEVISRKKSFIAQVLAFDRRDAKQIFVESEQSSFKKRSSYSSSSHEQYLGNIQCGILRRLSSVFSPKSNESKDAHKMILLVPEVPITHEGCTNLFNNLDIDAQKSKTCVSLICSLAKEDLVNVTTPLNPNETCICINANSPVSKSYVPRFGSNMLRRISSLFNPAQGRDSQISTLTNQSGQNELSEASADASFAQEVSSPILGSKKKKSGALTVESQEATISLSIDRLLTNENLKRIKEKTTTIVLFGASDSGCRTIGKQLKILYEDGFDMKYRSNGRSLINVMLYATFKTLCILITEKFNRSDLSTAVMDAVVLLSGDREISFSTQLSEEVTDAMHLLWNTEAFQKLCVSDPCSIIFDDSAGYIMANLDRVTHFNFCPTTQDLLHIDYENSAKSFEQSLCQIGDSNFNIVQCVDVTHTRWHSYIEAKSTLIYVVSAASYCQNLDDDPTINRLLFALANFESICLNPMISASNFVVILNKLDLLEARMKLFKVNHYLPHYLGKNEPAGFLGFLTCQFKRYARSGRTISVHQCAATDTYQVRAVIENM